MTVAGLVSKADDVQKVHVGNAVLVQKVHLKSLDLVQKVHFRLCDSVQSGQVKVVHLIRFVAVATPPASAASGEPYGGDRTIGTYLAYILSSIVANEWKLTR